METSSLCQPCSLGCGLKVTSVKGAVLSFSYTEKSS
ncbi:hypothetical protein [Paenibacillus graminis]